MPITREGVEPVDTVDAQEIRTVLELGDLVTPMAVRAGVTLGVFSGIGDDGATLPALAERTSVDRPRLRALIEVLAERDLVEVDAEGGLSLTGAGRRLADDRSPVAGAFDLGTASGRYSYAVVDLVRVLTSGRSHFAERFGTDYWSLVDGDADRRREVASLSTPEPVFDADTLIDDPLWAGVGSVVDVGGGNGNVLAGLARRHPHLTGAVFDLPGRVRSAEDLIAGQGLGGRLRAVGGDFFDAVPTGFDAYLLNAILADWSDRSAGALLGSLRAAVTGTRGASPVLVVSEVDPARGLGSAAVHLSMLCGADGWIRTEDEVRTLVEANGFRMADRLAATDVRFTHVYRPA